MYILPQCFTLVLVVLIAEAKLKEKFSWKQMEFDWPNPEAEQKAIKSGQYVVENNLPLGVERWQNKLFITIPRWKSGVAASLNYVDLDSEGQSPKLKPYPSWESNNIPPTGYKESLLRDNSTVISPFRVQADACDRLWVLDTGVTDLLGDTKQIAPNSIIIFDLKTDKLIRRYELPKNQVKDESFLANIVVDSERSECDNAYAYLPDLGAYTLVVYSFHDNRSYRIAHHYFHFDPLQGDFNVGGVNFQWTDGIFGMTIGPINPDHSKDIYFHPLASTKEFKVSDYVLRNESYVISKDAFFEFKLVGDRGMNGQSTAEVYDKETGVIFYTQVNKDAIACWNVKRPYNPDTQGLVDSNSQTLIFPNDMKIDAEGNLWVLSDKMPTYIYETLDPENINFRVFTGKIRDLIKGTKCEV
ncbi:protein yellow [Glossina fuscipes]|uniref:Protein yellow n=1 Tax=Glossina fuscipes TaxID=7396 RepID=A0A9C6E069_9MUSC|nr:protein yellow [Glossina fuscipes]